jgi:hypothetical protein
MPSLRSAVSPQGWLSEYILITFLLSFLSDRGKGLKLGMSAARYISITDFLQNLESIIMAIWVAGTFIKISVLYYALVLGTAQWLNLSDYRPLIFHSVFCWCYIVSSLPLIYRKFPIGLEHLLFFIWQRSKSSFRYCY